LLESRKQQKDEDLLFFIEKNALNKFKGKDADNQVYLEFVQGDENDGESY